MKKWIFPLIVFFLEVLVFAPVFYRGYNHLLPEAISLFYTRFHELMLKILPFLRLPVEIDGKSYFAPSLLLFLFIVNIIFLTIYLIIVALKKHKIKMDKDAEVFVKRKDIDPFDPVFFINRFPLIRLIFLFVPTIICVFLGLFFLVDSFRESINRVDFLQFICAPLTKFYQRYDVALGNLFMDYLWYKIAIFVVMAISIFGFYWFTASFVALLIRNPLAKHRAKKAKEKFQKREKLLRQKVLVLENAEILKHAHFKKEKAAVQTIAKLDSRIKIEPPLYTKEILSETPNVVDLGVLIKDNQAETNVLQPMLYKKNIRTINKSDGTSTIPNFVEINNHLDPSLLNEGENAKDDEVVPQNSEENKEKELGKETEAITPIKNPKLRARFKKTEVPVNNKEDITLKPYFHDLQDTANLSPNEAFEKRVVAVKPIVRPVATKAKKMKISKEETPIDEEKIKISDSENTENVSLEAPAVIETEIIEKAELEKPKRKPRKKKENPKDVME